MFCRGAAVVRVFAFKQCFFAAFERFVKTQLIGDSERLASVIPDDPNMPYDVLDVVEELVDDGEFMQVHAEFARNIVVGFGRMAGSTVGIVANQPNEVAGVLDIDASDKGARFVRFCDAFNIPVLTLVDVPGFMPGTAQEQGGIIHHGAKMLVRVFGGYGAEDYGYLA